MQRWMQQAQPLLVLKPPPLPPLLPLCLTDVACGGMQVEDDLGDLDDTQVAEPGRKR